MIYPVDPISKMEAPSPKSQYSIEADIVQGELVKVELLRYCEHLQPCEFHEHSLTLRSDRLSAEIWRAAKTIYDANSVVSDARYFAVSVDSDSSSVSIHRG